MRWSKLKQLVEANFADSVRKSVALHSAAYGACTCGHAWITLDGTIVANFCTLAHFNRFRYGNPDDDTGITPEQKKRYENQPVEYGEMSRQDVYEACWSFVHELSFDDALASDDPLIQTLAVLDRRLGKRRYAQVAELNLHPLARRLFEARLASEVIVPVSA